MEKKKIRAKDHFNNIAFGKRLKEIRDKNDYTQHFVAEKCGMSTNFLSDIERGIKLPSIPNLIMLSNTLKISLDSLFIDSLSNVAKEDKALYMTDKMSERQKHLLNTIVTTIKDNF